MKNLRRTTYVTKNRLALVLEETRTYCKKFTSSYDAYEFGREIWDKNNIGLFEEFAVIYLSRANEIIGYSFLSMGGYSGTVVDGKMLFTSALKDSNCSAILLMHNHPSNHCKPSEADEKLTKNFCQFGKLIELPILDHIILTPDNGYFSFADNGLIE